jgi:contact-dependent growth inhibition (CDI) system CdiI-like immunity protein
MKQGKSSGLPAGFDPAHFPGLREFFSGYLHEDFIDEYGSAAGAARAFCGDASVEEAAQATAEWTKLRSTLKGKPISEVQQALHKLGGSWKPEEVEELSGLDRVFKSPGEAKT